MNFGFECWKGYVFTSTHHAFKNHLSYRVFKKSNCQVRIILHNLSFTQHATPAQCPHIFTYLTLVSYSRPISNGFHGRRWDIHIDIVSSASSCCHEGVFLMIAFSAWIHIQEFQLSHEKVSKVIEPLKRASERSGVSGASGASEQTRTEWATKWPVQIAIVCD